MDLSRGFSDSEDDGDYVPPEGEDSSSDSETEKPTNATPEENRDNMGSKDMKKIWESFEASISSASSSKSLEPGLKKVKVVKRYRFAGQEHQEVLEVPEGSEEARKWPAYQKTDLEGAPELGSKAPVVSDPVAPQPEPTEHPGPKPQPVKRKPGPRKPKTALAPLPGASKAKKITTLEKSAMDWKAHLDSEKQTGVQDELEANRRGGGYLEKVEFLQRVEERKEDKLDAERSTKRRKL
ncbi:bucentaur or craniofacial development-domain-containing protein [Coprinopsis sp. MPI-PUGE-AT-0042]|nr:bucentaur or craniofacial development-domain-containing protein [Coprinopsis sp. MPI-PUGE-AT-0042]